MHDIAASPSSYFHRLAAPTMFPPSPNAIYRPVPRRPVLGSTEADPPWAAFCFDHWRQKGARSRVSHSVHINHSDASAYPDSRSSWLMTRFARHDGQNRSSFSRCILEQTRFSRLFYGQRGQPPGVIDRRRRPPTMRTSPIRPVLWSGRIGLTHQTTSDCSPQCRRNSFWAASRYPETTIKCRQPEPRAASACPAVELPPNATTPGAPRRNRR